MQLRFQADNSRECVMEKPLLIGDCILMTIVLCNFIMTSFRHYKINNEMNSVSSNAGLLMIESNHY